jgi:hypothetical protein
MRLIDLGVLYGGIGIACAVVLYRRSPERDREALAAALAAVPLWPIWAPIAWTARPEPNLVSGTSADRVERIRSALDEAVELVRGSPLERVLGRGSARAIMDEAERLSARNDELVGLLARDEFDVAAAMRRLEALEGAQASPRVVSSARLHLENVRRLHHLARGEARALDELAALVVALRTELMVVKLSGSSVDGVDDIVRDLSAHIEGLRQATEEAANPPGVPAETRTPA